jgi:peptide deformylase
MLITNDEAALRVKCEDVTSDEIAPLREALELELARCERLGRSGVGLAAPQIGIAKKMAIVRLDHEFKFDLVNARLEHGYDPRPFHNEGCLSFPGRIETTTRFQEIVVAGNLLHPKRFVATGMLAVVCQHELDHVTQTLFFDKAIPKKLKVGPNEKCVCGSDKKFKKCCGK